MTSPNGLPAYYPLFLKIGGRRCVVVGGGPVALRKVTMLREFGGQVDVVSPDLCPELERMAGDGLVRLFRRRYRPGDLDGATVAVAATDDEETNRAVAAEARRRGVLVNVVDDAEASDFIVPSYVHRGDVTLAVSTGGQSPALARKLRARLEREFGEEYACLARLIGDVRAELRRRRLRVPADVWQEALDIDRLVALVREGDTGGARSLLLDRLIMAQARAEDD